MSPAAHAFRASTSPARKPAPKLRYVPVETMQQTEAINGPSAERCECGKCSKLYTGSSVVTRQPEYDASKKAHIALRMLYCDHCHHIQSWREGVVMLGQSPEGESLYRLTGYVFSGPGYITGKHSIAQFLARHPEATGVIDNG